MKKLSIWQQNTLTTALTWFLFIFLSSPSKHIVNQEKHKELWRRNVCLRVKSSLLEQSGKEGRIRKHRWKRRVTLGGNRWLSASPRCLWRMFLGLNAQWASLHGWFTVWLVNLFREDMPASRRNQQKRLPVKFSADFKVSWWKWCGRSAGLFEVKLKNIKERK